jgi:hypothetical protein
LDKEWVGFGGVSLSEYFARATVPASVETAAPGLLPITSLR